MIELNVTEPKGDDFMLSIMEKIKSRREALQSSMNRFDMENKVPEDKVEKVNFISNKEEDSEYIKNRHEKEFEKDDLIHDEESIHNEVIDYSITNTDTNTQTIMNTNKEYSINETNRDLYHIDINKKLESKFEEKENYDETFKALLQNEGKEINLEKNINFYEKEDGSKKLNDSIIVLDCSKKSSNEKLESSRIKTKC